MDRLYQDFCSNTGLQFYILQSHYSASFTLYISQLARFLLITLCGTNEQRAYLESLLTQTRLCELGKWEQIIELRRYTCVQKEENTCVNYVYLAEIGSPSHKSNNDKNMLKQFFFFFILAAENPRKLMEQQRQQEQKSSQFSALSVSPATSLASVRINLSSLLTFPGIRQASEMDHNSSLHQLFNL